MKLRDGPPSVAQHVCSAAANKTAIMTTRFVNILEPPTEPRPMIPSIMPIARPDYCLLVGNTMIKPKSKHLWEKQYR